MFWRILWEFNAFKAGSKWSYVFDGETKGAFWYVLVHIIVIFFFLIFFLIINLLFLGDFLFLFFFHANSILDSIKAGF